MKLLLPLITAFVLFGCKSEEPVPEKPKEKTEAQVRAFLAEQSTLLNQKHRLEKQLNRIVSTSKVDPTGEMKLVSKEKQQAIIDLQTIRNTHPNLQKLNADLKLWQGRQHSALTLKHSAEAEQAREKIVELIGKIHSLSNELPAIREAEDRITRSEKKIAELRRSLAEKTPEGKALIGKIKEIKEQLSSMK